MRFLSQLNWKILAQICFLLSLSLCSGCKTSDHWYELDTLYSDYPFQETIIPIDQDSLPKQEWKAEPLLPAPEEGKLALSLEQAVLISLRRNRELQVQRYSPVIA